MPHLHFLGTGASVSDAHRTTSMLALENQGSVLVVDCGGDVVQRLLACGLDPGAIEAVIITHEHPDHVSGFPLMIQRLWLEGRSSPLPVYGIGPALAQARRCFQAFDTAGWTGLPEIHWRECPAEPGVEVLASRSWRVTATPSRHSVPSMALRFQSPAQPGTQGGCVYSCDTEAAPEIARFATGAEVLVHEATGAFPGHSTPQAAARVAVEAGARRLYLIHLPRLGAAEAAELREAREIFPATTLAPELGQVAFD